MLRSRGLFERCCGVNEDVLDNWINVIDYSNKQNSMIRKSNTYENMRCNENYENFNEEVD